MQTTLTNRELRWYQTKDGTALQERITVEGNDGQVFVQQDWLDVKLVVECDHDWIDATNEFIQSGELCTKCHAVRATPPEPIKM